MASESARWRNSDDTENDSSSSSDEREPLHCNSNLTYSTEATYTPSHQGYGEPYQTSGENMEEEIDDAYHSEYQNSDLAYGQGTPTPAARNPASRSGINSFNRKNRLHRLDGAGGSPHLPRQGLPSTRLGRPGEYPGQRGGNHRLLVATKSPSASSQSEMSYPEGMEPYSTLSDHGTPPPAPAPGVPEYPPRVSSFQHPSLVAQRAATLVVKKENDEPPTYEVIPYATGKTSPSTGAWNFLPGDRALIPGTNSLSRGMAHGVPATIPHQGNTANHVLTAVPGDPSGRLVMTLLPQGHEPMALTNSRGYNTTCGSLSNSHQNSNSLRPSWLRNENRGRSHGRGKNCATPRCSWRLLAIGLLLTCGLLAAALAYLTVSSVGSNYKDESCIPTEGAGVNRNVDGGIVGQDPSVPRGTSVSAVSELSPSPEHRSSRQDQLVPQSADKPPEQPESPSVTLGSHRPASSAAAAELEANDQWNWLSIDPASLWNGYVKVNSNLALKISLQLPRGAPFAIYGRRNVPPSITQQDFSEFLQETPGHSVDFSRMKRQALNMTGPVFNVTLVKPVEPGRWFIGIYNDDVVRHDMGISLTLTNDVATPCPEDCNGRGQCANGKCLCKDGFAGTDCSISVCPVLCSGRGTYGGGRCHCDAGWTGLECDIPDAESDFPRGICNPACSANGNCINGRCVCQPNFTGPTCETALPSCKIDCGPHGKCLNNRCVCQAGWMGQFCHLVATSCDERCSQRGQCINGTCVCSRGWNGRHCTLDGCPGNCGSANGRGTCVQDKNGNFGCECSPDWTGSDCSVMLESDCNDDKDNDGDGLTDCADSECCSHPACSGHLMCLASASPAEIAARKAPLSSSASFYQRVKFLVEDNAVQSYAHKDECVDKRVSVIRGRVISQQGLGIVGVRVSVERHQRLGFTLTRHGGWFDILVNGGGSVTLQFQRNPFKPEMRAVLVPWNKILVLENVILRVSEDGPLTASLRGYRQQEKLRTEDVKDLCDPADLELLVPGFLDTPESDTSVSGSSGTTIMADTRVLYESIVVPGMEDIQMVYSSSSSPSFYSLVHLKLTGEDLPGSLAYVHLRIVVEGTVTEEILEADSQLTYTFAWDRFNAYRQKVYGTADIFVHVGYEMYNCSQSITWKTIVTTVPAFSPEISGIGDLNVNINHHYNVPQNILYKGDGGILYFKSLERTVNPVLGTGSPRSLSCVECQAASPAAFAKILNPVAMATAGDGSLYIGDFNLIRKLTPEGRVFPVLQLPSGQVSHSYYLAVSPADGSLYVSDCERRQILRVSIVREEQLLNPSTAPPNGLENNFDVAAGNGEPCLPGDSHKCGDGGPALEARLAYPKGIVIAADRTIYFADGTSIRTIDPSGVIRTLIGSPASPIIGLHPAPCESVAHITQIQPQWPTQLGLNPVDGSLHWLDTNVVLRLSAKQFVHVVAGSPQHCKASKERTTGSITHFAFSPSGQVHMAEKINSTSVRLIKIDSQSRSQGIAVNNSSAEQDIVSVSSLSIGPDGVIYVADNSQLKIFALEYAGPAFDIASGEFSVTCPDSGQIFVFNRHGQHITTKDSASGSIRTTFSYTKAASNGKLMAIIDARGNKIDFVRDSYDRITSIETSSGFKTQLGVDKQGHVAQINQSLSIYTLLEYDPVTSFLIGRAESSGLATLYQYDSNGRLETAVFPNGETLTLTSDTKKNVRINWIQENPMIMDITSYAHNKTSHLTSGDDLTSYASSSKEANRMEWPHRNSFQLSRPNTSSFVVTRIIPTFKEGSWQDSVLEKSWTHIRLNGRIEEKTLEVNSVRQLMAEIDPQSGSRTFYDGERQLLMTLTCDPQGHLKELRPSPGFHGIRYTYDNYGRLQTRSWGFRHEMYSYDTPGRLTQIRTRDGATGFRSINYAQSDQPIRVSLPSGRSFTYSYDQSGGLKSVGNPSESSRHSYSLQASLGFFKLAYQPPGSTLTNQSYVQHFDALSRLTLILFPGDCGRVSYHYDNQSRLVEEVSGDRKVETSYSSTGRIVSLTEKDFESRTEQISNNGIVYEDKAEFASRTGLAGSKFVYSYDHDSRLTAIKGRIGGQILGHYVISYQPKTTVTEQFGQFKMSRLRLNETSYFDGTAIFSRVLNHYLDVAQTSLTIHNTEVFKMEYTYDNWGRINQTRTYTRYGGLKSYVNVKNLSYDDDGQFIAVEAPESWRFSYDSNGNLAKLTYRGNSISMKHDSSDRLIRFGEGVYHYDDAGNVLQNAREEKFYWSASGLLTRAVKKGIFDVRYFYDHQQRLVARRDHHGNVTQFFYANPQYPYQVTHLFSPRDLKLTSLTYDDRGHLMHVQILRQRYYVATDQCGTPLVVFNQHGDLVRELVRSPFGHVVYDSNPYLYLPVDWQGGILDPATTLIHLHGNRIYDPLIGQWLNPDWSRAFQTSQPEAMHLYRLPRNDPINIDYNLFVDDYHSWMRKLGYNIQLPQHSIRNVDAFNIHLKMDQILPQTNPEAQAPPRVAIGPFFKFYNQLGSYVEFSDLAQGCKAPPREIVRPVRFASAQSPLGNFILLSRNVDNRVIVRSNGYSDPVLRDFYTSVLNNSIWMNLTLPGHHQDTFFFFKKDTRRINEDMATLRRLGPLINFTTHDITDSQSKEIRISSSQGIFTIVYGSDLKSEADRLWRHVTKSAIRRAWHREQTLLNRGGVSSMPLTGGEMEKLAREGHLNSYRAETQPGFWQHPILVDDPRSIRFRKRGNP